MASKNLLPVVALCGALATGTPVAAWATPVMADSLPAALSPAPGPSNAIACKRFSLAQAAISTSGCLRRNTDSSIVVDIKHSSKTNGSQAGCAVCTWRSVVLMPAAIHAIWNYASTSLRSMTRRTERRSPSTVRILRKETVYVWAAPPRMQTTRSPPSHSRPRCG